MPKKTAKKRVKKVAKKPATLETGGRYTDKQQRDAAERVLLLKETVASVARELGCAPISVFTWVEKYKDTILTDATTNASKSVSKNSVKKGDVEISSRNTAEHAL